jgi:hypothetical protein
LAKDVGARPGQATKRHARRDQDPVFRRGEAPAPDALVTLADRYELGTLPERWRNWLARCGWEQQPDFGWELLGLTPAPSGLDVRALLAGIRFNLPGFPSDLVPIEWLPERQLACVRVSGQAADPPVVLVDLDDPATWASAQPTAGTFTEYAREFLAQAHDVRRIRHFLAKQEAAIDSGRRAKDQLPRPDDWRVYRFCSQNVIIAMPLLRFDRDRNALAVAACPITRLTQLAPDAPARAVCTLLLSEAYRAGGDLTVQFFAGAGRGARPAPVPAAIVRWARRCGIVLEEEGVIDAASAHELFAASVRVSDQMRDRLRAMPNDGVAALCYGVASGTWPAPAAEGVLAWSDDPLTVLTGDTDPLQRARHALDLRDTQSALLLATLIARVAAGSGSEPLDAEDAQQDVELSVLPDRAAIISVDGIELEAWWVERSAPPPASAFRVQVVDGELDQLLAALADAVAQAPAGSALLCPKDVRSLDAAALTGLLEQMRSRNVALLAGPEYTTTLGNRAADVLARARGARQ